MSRRRLRGFTLVEMLSTLAVAGIVSAVAVPAWSHQRERVQRQEAVTLLTRVQAEQELFRARHGRYARQLSQLGSVGVAAGAQGAYRITLVGTDPWRYVVRAAAVDPARAARDCGTLRLDVDEGFAAIGPTPRCWNR